MSITATINGKKADTFTLKKFVPNLEINGSINVGDPSTKLSFTRMGGNIVKSARLVFSKIAKEFKLDLQSQWPVKSGASRAGWKIKANQHGWAVSNNVVNPITGEHYVPKLWVGTPVGSRQLPRGGDPIFRQYAAKLQIALAGRM